MLPLPDKRPASRILFFDVEQADRSLVQKHFPDATFIEANLEGEKLIDACKEQEPYLALIAVRKLLVGEVDPDGRAVVMAYDVKPIA